MRSEGFLKRFHLRRWVEGPLEGMMDLSADAEGYRARAQLILTIGIAVALFSLLLLTAILLADIWSMVFQYLNPVSIVSQDMARLVTEMALAGTFMALALLSTLLLIQIMRYISVMFKRFENVEDLLGVPKTAPAGKAQPVEQSPPGPYMGMFNILGASSAFTKDIVRNMPQVCRQMKFVRTMLMLMPLYYLGLRFGVPLIFDSAILPGHINISEIMFDALLISLSASSVIAGILICETRRFMDAVYAQLKLVDSIRNAPQPLLPKLDTPAERLAKYLEGNIKGCKVTSGTSGFAIHHVSQDCIVLAIETAVAPDLELVRGFTESCKKELGKLSTRPHKGRFIILYAPRNGNAEDIGEDVEKHILANPISLGRGPGEGNAETVIQIMIEEEGAYGMFPFVE